MGVHEDRIARIVLEAFNKLPAKSKPAVRANGRQDWVPLSGIVICSDDEDLTCLALATGMKCLPAAKIPQAQGFVLHDWHAEILAIRAFNHFLIQECQNIVNSPGTFSTIVRKREDHEKTKLTCLQPFTLHENLKICMYCSEAPCGDASMEIIMQAQEDATPWPIFGPEPGLQAHPGKLQGRGYFSELGIVRRKPSRPDSPLSLSKSCSDKLALKQCTSLLSSPTTLLISPENAYLDRLILPYSQYSPVSCDRAFGPTGRMKTVAENTWSSGYSFRPFGVETTNQEFSLSRRSLQSLSTETKGSNVSALWTPRLQETLINGVLQGRKHTDPKGSSAVSNLRMWSTIIQVLASLRILAFEKCEYHVKYQQIKGDGLLEDRRRVKEEVRTESLKGWVRNEGDDFELRC